MRSHAKFQTLRIILSRRNRVCVWLGGVVGAAIIVSNPTRLRLGWGFDKNVNSLSPLPFLSKGRDLIVISLVCSQNDQTFLLASINIGLNCVDSYSEMVCSPPPFCLPEDQTFSIFSFDGFLHTNGNSFYPKRPNFFAGFLAHRPVHLETDNIFLSLEPQK